MKVFRPPAERPPACSGSSPERAGKSRPARLLPWLFGTAAGLVVFLLYLRTLAPDILYYASPGMLDPAMLQTHVSALGITHPTGYPGYVMLTHLFTYLPFGNEAYTVSLASAVYGALTVALVYAAGYVLTRRAAAAAVGAIGLGLGSVFWSQAVIAEVYTLNTLMIVASLLTLLLWREKHANAHGDRYLLAFSLLAGLAMTNHLTSGLLLPAGALFVWLVDRSRFRDLGLVLKGAALFILGLLPYLYLPIRASSAKMAEARPDTLSEFLMHVSGSELTNSRFGGSFLEPFSVLANYGQYALSEFSLILLTLAAVGAGAMFGRDKKAMALVGTLFAGWLIYALGYNIPDIYVYYIPTFLMAAIWISYGAAALLEAAKSLSHRLPGAATRAALPLVLSALVLLAPFIGVREAYAQADRSEADLGRRTIEAVAENVEPGSTVIHNRSALWYMVLVEERRRDLTLIDPFHPDDITTYDLVWPTDVSQQRAEQRYQTGDTTAVPAAREAAEDGPVYILDQNLTSGSNFAQAGFEVVEVEPGILYRLVPEGSQSG